MDEDKKKIPEEIDYSKYDFKDPELYVFSTGKGISEKVVEQISRIKEEPEWMLELRLKGYEVFKSKPLPLWGADLSEINFDDYTYYLKPTEKKGMNWDEVPEYIKKTFERLGIPEAERRFLAGLGAQYECLSGDSLVHTQRGPVPIEEIEPGDIVFSYDEKNNCIVSAGVKAKTCKGIREVFEVKIGSRTIKATKNHPFLFLEDKGNGRMMWKYLSELKPGDPVAVVNKLPGDKGNYPASLNFIKIQSITPAGTSFVYDIEVEGPHNFVAEGIIVHNSEMVYHNIREDLAKKGVIFMDTDSALKEYPEIFREYFGKVVPYTDNKFAALNYAVWSGGSFIYVPPGVKVDIPLQAYFRINAQAMGQFERTLIIADEGSSVHYVEGCTAPIYSKDSLHAAVVEVIAKKHAKVRYTTIQNWSKNIYNLVTKRAIAYEDAIVEWIDGNIGSGVTMKYPAVILRGKGARAEILSIAYAGKNQHLDAGAKVIHLAPSTFSTIRSKSVSRSGGRSTYRGLVKVVEGAKKSRVSVKCDALILDEFSRSDTYPHMEIEENDTVVLHEATVGKITEDQIFYLTSRGLTEEEALSMIVRGFIEPFTRELPMEYAIELNRLIQLEMEGCVG